MSTSSHSIRRQVRRAALAVAATAICLPAGSALAAGDTKYDLAGTRSASTPSSAGIKAGDTPADFPGTSDVTSGTVEANKGDTPADFPGMPDGPVVVQRVTGAQPQAAGFDWTSAAVGAGGAGLLIVVSLGGASAATGMRMRRIRS